MRALQYSTQSKPISACVCKAIVGPTMQQSRHGYLVACCYWGSGSWSYEKVAGRTSGWLLPICIYMLPADRSIAWSEFTFFNYSISMHA